MRQCRCVTMRCCNCCVKIARELLLKKCRHFSPTFFVLYAVLNDKVKLADQAEFKTCKFGGDITDITLVCPREVIFKSNRDLNQYMKSPYLNSTGIQYQIITCKTYMCMCFSLINLFR